MGFKVDPETERKMLELAGPGRVQTFAGPQPAAVVLPMPPSANRIWRSVVIGGKVRVLKSAEYRRWLAEAVPLAAAVGPVPTPCGVALTVHGCHPQSDLDNKIKAVLDCIRAAGVIPNDSVKHVVQVGAGYRPDPVDGRPAVRVELWPISKT